MLLVLVVAVSAFALAAIGDREALVVWSCGGNYQFLCDYVIRFEQEHDCHVSYTAAPVQYLLEEAVYGESQPDVIVGRGGPGWLALRQCGKMTGDPTFFAVDPLVVVVPPDNPAGIRSVADVGRKGVRVAWTPHSMRPKSKVPALFMATLDKSHPGIMDAWVGNAIEAAKCGREMLRPLLDETADVAVAPLSLTTYPEYRGKVTVIPIDPKHLLAMKKGRPSMPQCAGGLEGGPRTDVARAFVEGLADASTSELLERHGYIPVSSEACRPYDPMLKVSSPRDFPAIMTRTAQLLARYGAQDEARRRYLMVIHIAGPSHFGARARYRLGELASEAGDSAPARHHWERVVAEFPPEAPVEYECRVLQVSEPVEGVERMPYEHWIGLAEEGLASLSPGQGEASPWQVRAEPLPLLESDPPKSGKRWLTLGEDHFRAGDPRYAIRDSLKVSTLQHPSPYSADAEYNIGIYQASRGNMDLAVEQWQRVVADYPGSAALRLASEALAEHGTDTKPESPFPPMPPRPEVFDTHPQRNMTYGLRLYHHGLALYSFKEMLKIIHSKAAGTGLAAEARYRAGIACLALESPEAAARQWKLGQAHYPGSKWASDAAEALAELPAEARERTVDIPEPPEPAKGMGPLHYTIGEELHLAGLYQDDEVLLQYLKPLTTAMPKDPESPLMAKAAVQAGIFLQQTKRPELAREMYQLAIDNWPEAPPTKKARARLKAMGGGQAGKGPGR